MNEVILLPATDSNGTMVVFTKQMLEDMGSSPDDLRNTQYFTVKGANDSPPPGLYRIRQTNSFNVFAYKIMDFEKEEVPDEDLSDIQGGSERDTERSSGDGDTSPSQELPRQNRKR